MKNIAILTGGDSAERIISLQSAAVVDKHLSQNAAYRCFQIDIEGAKWHECESKQEIDKNDFSLMLKGEKVHFDVVFAALHGSPLEDGKLQGYFDVLGIPYTCCDGFVSAMLMDKHLSKTIAKPYGVPMAESQLLVRGAAIDSEALLTMGLPLFVKPNTHGSSFGITKVKTEAELMPAIQDAFFYDNQVVVESFLAGREFSNGVFRKNGEVVALPITEIIPETEWFDFAAKYEGKSEEVTPAALSESETTACQTWSKLLYKIFECKGAVRFDYILSDGKFCFLEGNTIPGLSEASLLPQQAVAAGYSLADFFAMQVESALSEI